MKILRIFGTEHFKTSNFPKGKTLVPKWPVDPSRVIDIPLIYGGDEYKIVPQDAKLKIVDYTKGKYDRTSGLSFIHGIGQAHYEVELVSGNTTKNTVQIGDRFHVPAQVVEERLELEKQARKAA